MDCFASLAMTRIGRGVPACAGMTTLIEPDGLSTPSVNPGLIRTTYDAHPRFRTIANDPNPMKIGTLLTAAIVSLSAVGGGLAVYVAATKYQTMDKVSVAQSRLELVRAVGEIPRYMNPERGFATNIMFGPPTVDPKLLAELDKYRKNTDGARDKMNKVKATLPGAIDDSAAVGSSIDALNTQFAALRTGMDN